MACPLYRDFTRECVEKIESLPADTMGYCESGKYKDCPFYRIITRKGEVCANVAKCSAFAKFRLGDFEKFVEISNRFCTSKDHVKCKRFILKASGKDVPVTLHPDGRMIKEWA
jgi:hypothetical protein